MRHCRTMTAQEPFSLFQVLNAASAHKNFARRLPLPGLALLLQYVCSCNVQSALPEDIAGRMRKIDAHGHESAVWGALACNWIHPKHITKVQGRQQACLQASLVPWHTYWSRDSARRCCPLRGSCGQWPRSFSAAAWQLQAYCPGRAAGHSHFESRIGPIGQWLLHAFL